MEALDQRAGERRRTLLIGFPPLIRAGLEPALGAVSDVLAVPFPDEAFERAVDGFDPHLVIVDGTYFAEELVRPLITHRLHRNKPMVVYLTEARTACIVEDLRGRQVASGDATIAALVALAAGHRTEAGLLWSPVISRSRRRGQPASNDACAEQAETDGGNPQGGTEMVDFISMRLAAMRREEGQALVEYALILALVSIASIVLLGTVGQDVNTVLQTVDNALKGA
jgi:pilus assembly protein Flp/PilA